MCRLGMETLAQGRQSLSLLDDLNWVSRSSVCVCVCAWSYCSLLWYVWLMSLGGLVFSEGILYLGKRRGTELMKRMRGREEGKTAIVM